LLSFRPICSKWADLLSKPQSAQDGGPVETAEIPARFSPLIKPFRYLRNG
jgi:hypothetical protein